MISKLTSFFAQKKFNKNARKMEKRNREKMVSDGVLITAGTLMDSLGWAKLDLEIAQKENRIFSIDVYDEPHYPAFFVDPKNKRKQLETVIKILGDLPGSSKFQFFTCPKISLAGLTPLQALAQGKMANVKISAEGFAER